MTKKETKSLIKEIREFTKKVASSPKKSRQFLVNAGICTAKGNLKKVYR